ncbi:hypothetical protein [Candidatus Tisiphia endosymbiont of Ditula angustiorana]
METTRSIISINILLVNEELVDEDQNQQVLGVSKPRNTAYIST